MDVLSSQANIAGYKVVTIAADKYRRFLGPCMPCSSRAMTRRSCGQLRAA